ncbi:hypothetical protein BD311DRAFT_778985 [Dichomitus squalens]|uniref:Mid2 domain-containing protein n=1 Tax=Dichomitus squalens TaxID=114155 RepID=A0A4Q9MIL2_9APHY|nr:hypothetical protein BD311DRAFT_778985 [Dichomitus squalens]
MLLLHLILSLLLLCTFPLARAGVATADDTDAGMFYSGLWVPDGDPNTFGHHDTWTNQSGASVSFDFIGTQIQVFATRRPAGTYLTNVSFSVDGGAPTLWLSEDFVPQITYQNLVYTSGDLSPTQHQLTITNLGGIFWLDFVQYETADSAPVTSNAPGTTTSAPRSTTSETAAPPFSTSQHLSTVFQTQTASTTSSTSPETSSSGTVPGSSMTTGTTVLRPPTDLSVSTPQTSTTGGAPVQSPSPGSTTDGNTGLSAAPAATGSSSKTSIIVGVVVGVVGVIALLLAAFWWLRMRRKSQTSDKSAAMPYDTAHTPEAAQFSKGQLLASPAVQTPDSWSRMPLVSERGPPSTDSSLSSPGFSHYTHNVEPLDADAAGFLEKLRADQASSPRGSSATDRPLPYLPGPQMRPMPGRADGAAPVSLATSAGSSSGGNTSFSGALSPPQSPWVQRTFREARDGGVRLAGGPIADPDANMFTPAGYDTDVVETLPPSYAQLHAAGLDES